MRRGCPPTLDRRRRDRAAHRRRGTTSRTASAASWLGLGRNAKAIWQDLVSDHEFVGGYASVKRFVRKLRGSRAPEERAVIETAPGEEAPVDHGEAPMLRHPETGKYRRTRLFVLSLGFSRKPVRLLLFRSSSREWAELHERAFRRVGGATRIVVLDNLREGVLKPDVYDAGLNPLYRDVLAHYGAIAMLCRVGDPGPITLPRETTVASETKPVVVRAVAPLAATPGHLPGRDTRRWSGRQRRLRASQILTRDQPCVLRKCCTDERRPTGFVCVEEQTVVLAPWLRPILLNLVEVLLEDEVLASDVTEAVVLAASVSALMQIHLDSKRVFDACPRGLQVVAFDSKEEVGRHVQIPCLPDGNARSTCGRGSRVPVYHEVHGASRHCRQGLLQRPETKLLHLCFTERSGPRGRRAKSHSEPFRAREERRTAESDVEVTHPSDVERDARAKASTRYRASLQQRTRIPSVPT